MSEQYPPIGINGSNGSLGMSSGTVDLSVLLTSVQTLFDNLQTNKQSQQAIQLTLDTVIQSTRAGQSFWFSPIGQTEAMAGESALTMAECRHLAEKLQEQFAGEKTIHLKGSEDHRSLVANKPVYSLAFLRADVSGTGLLALGLEEDEPILESDVDFTRLAVSLLRQQHQQLQNHNRFQDTLVGLVQAFAAAVDAKDSYTAGHSERVARIALTIGQQMQLSRKELGDIYLGGLFHDIGKIGIRDEVLKKPGRLTEEEFAHIREHTIIGDTIISKIKQFHQLRCAVRSHHERYDGNGYPDGLAGEEIPFLARLLCVADACDAMMSPRRYRDALCLIPPQIDQVMTEESEKQFDPDIVEHFMACREKIYPPIYRKGIGESAYHAIDSSLMAEMDPRD